MEDLGWTRRRGSSPAARRGARQRTGLTPVSASNTLSMPAGDTSHPNQINPIKNPLDSEHGIYLRIPTIATTHSDGSRPAVPIDRDQRGAGADGAVG
jgi:hypothetical protein